MINNTTILLATILCEVCNKQISKSNKAKHMKQHDINSKKYHCDFCDYQTIRKDNFLKHLNNKVCQYSTCLYCNECVLEDNKQSHILSDEHKHYQMIEERRQLKKEKSKDSKWISKHYTVNKMNECIKYEPKANWLKRKQKTVTINKINKTNKITKSVKVLEKSQVIEKAVEKVIDYTLSNEGLKALNNELDDNYGFKICSNDIKTVNIIQDGFEIILNKKVDDNIKICYVNSSYPCVTTFKNELDDDYNYMITDEYLNIDNVNILDSKDIIIKKDEVKDEVKELDMEKEIQLIKNRKIKLLQMKENHMLRFNNIAKFFNNKKKNTVLKKDNDELKDKMIFIQQLKKYRTNALRTYKHITQPQPDKKASIIHEKLIGRFPRRNVFSMEMSL